jgi:hypothetical protein
MGDAWESTNLAHRMILSPSLKLSPLREQAESPRMFVEKAFKSG